VDMLGTMAGDYLSRLKGFTAERRQQDIVEEAHKIKGAAGSVGLKRVQLLAQQIQSPDLPDWWEQLDHRVSELERLLEPDLAELRHWLESRL